MSKILKTYTFTGFGFNVLLKNVPVKDAHGETYPDINMNELKLMTAKALLKRPVRMVGFQIKFLRTFMRLSFDAVSEKIGVPASTLRLWETKGAEVTGLSLEQEKAFRIYVVNTILENERNQFDKELILTKTFSEPKKDSEILDVAANVDYSFVSHG